MKKLIRVKVTEVYLFANQEDADAFADYKGAEAAEHPELQTINFEVSPVNEKQPA